MVARVAWTARTAKGLSVPTDSSAVAGWAPPEKAQLPASSAGDSGNWQARAACRGSELAVFFAPDAERGHARARREAHARQICLPCPVLEQCRDHALTVGEPYGVWGGMTEADRRRHTKRLRSGERRTSRFEANAPCGDGTGGPMIRA
ncbi:putative WhiB family regulatory protein [Rhodococcus opacus B4]|uniref:Transcriptional regulator WhiB n=1 Tax=Rhodococcus opacus (strain B4) TaxID=632772 RepID=C1B4F5_RHOOB|nr:putative WhiB family regulatory protein [Rhodococcus opacus B4]